MNYNQVDFVGLAHFFEEFNNCGERVKVRFANDAVDQVTLHFRALGGKPESMECKDFAEALLAVAKGAKSPVDVRASWVQLHKLQDRTHAPPPMLLMFVVEGGFEAVMLWSQQLGMRLNIKAASPMMLIMGNAQESDYRGRLSPDLMKRLEADFGIPFKRPALLSALASTAPPAWAQQPD
ncbi:hypothetical protein APY03_0935 [Variovorax sp. WDL1]|nr:hypothetical protein APY03_0935 [Variovorax sp. WDL1]